MVLKNRKLIAALLAGTLIFSTACGTADEESTSPATTEATATTDTTTAETQATAAANEDTRVIQDALGREVEVPANVESVASHGTGARMVIYAGGLDHLIGVTEGDQRDNVAMPYGYVNHEHLSTLPVVSSGQSADNIYEEQVVELNPDIIVTSAADPEFLDTMQERTGIPVVGLLETIVQNNVFDDEILRMISLLGELFGTEEQAESVVSALEEWEQDLQERTGDIPEDERNTAYTGAVSFNGAHGFDGTYAKYMPFDLVNVINVVDETGQEGAFNVDLEKVPEWDPDYIFLNPQNMDLVNEQYADNPDYFHGLSAVQAGEIYSQPAYIFSGTNFELAIANTYYAGKVVYPDRFEDVDMDEKVDEIFQVFLGVTYADELEEAGLSFTQMTLGEE